MPVKIETRRQSMHFFMGRTAVLIVRECFKEMKNLRHIRTLIVRKEDSAKLHSIIHSICLTQHPISRGQFVFSVEFIHLQMIANQKITVIFSYIYWPAMRSSFISWEWIPPSWYKMCWRRALPISYWNLMRPIVKKWAKRLNKIKQLSCLYGRFMSLMREWELS